MEKATSLSGLVRTKSDQLVETLAAAFKSPPPSVAAGSGGSGEVSESVGASRRSSRRMTGASPGRNGGKNTHIRKSRSAQMKFEVEEMISSGAALSRASSASLGLSFSFTGFNMPPDDIIADSNPFSDDDIRKSASRSLSYIFHITCLSHF
ncbi:unnamed protein product [Linum trigynum]|uniref:Uncharacterized protein n=1 Tax=Linum trigynum TaxID=586398 RepID=A0AAV2DBV1_9ROSI